MGPAIALLLACSGPADPGAEDGPAESGPASSAPSIPESSESPVSPVSPVPTVPRQEPLRQARLRGVDVSHHQGEIDWPRVADDGISFAYLKATEGSTFTDPRFAANWAGATQAGLRVGAYHYFTLCSPAQPQADHYLAALASVGAGPRSLPPVVDLELIGNCDPPPARPAMMAAAVDFIARVEEATGRRVVVYAHPDFERTYDLLDVLDRRRWVRRTGTRPPPGEWWLWQRSDRAQVDGISTPVDLDVMR